MEQAYQDLGDKVQINVKHLKAGTVLNCPTFDEAGNEVLPPYTPFTQEDIDRLLGSNREKIYYSKLRDIDNLRYSKNLKDLLTKKVYNGPRSIQLNTQKKALGAMEKLLGGLEQQENVEKVDMNETKGIIEDIVNDLNASDTEIVNLLDIQSFDDFTYTHGLNVGIISMVFARKMKLDEELVKEIGLGGFLHDIGKIRMPFDLLHKASSLSDKDLKTMRNHPRYGYEMLKGSSQITEMVKKIVLLHHEKFDGSGYPFGFKDTQIDDAIYIVAIAEIYDTLTSTLAYRKALTPKEALKVLLRDSGSHFKPEIAHQFAKSMGILMKESSYFEIGTYVLLNTKEVAKIVAKDSDVTTRPSVEIIKNSQGKTLASPIAVDLNMDGTRDIVRVLDNEEENRFE